MLKSSAEYTGTPASGYQVESVSTTPNVISIAGSEEALDSLKDQNNTIWVSAVMRLIFQVGTVILRQRSIFQIICRKD